MEVDSDEENNEEHNRVIHDLEVMENEKDHVEELEVTELRQGENQDKFPQ